MHDLYFEIRVFWRFSQAAREQVIQMLLVHFLKAACGILDSSVAHAGM
jgi:hypothetical protein